MYGSLMSSDEATKLAAAFKQSTGIDFDFITILGGPATTRLREEIKANKAPDIFEASGGWVIGMAPEGIKKLAEVVVRCRARRVDGERFLVRGECASRVAARLESDAEVEMRLRQARRETDGPPIELAGAPQIAGILGAIAFGDEGLGRISRHRHKRRILGDARPRIIRPPHTRDRHAARLVL